MPDNGQPGTGADGGTPDATDDDKGSQQSNAAGGTSDAAGGTPDSAAEDTEALRKAIRTERAAVRELRDQLRELQEKDLPEKDRATKRVSELEEENRSLAEQLVRERTSNEVTRAATSLGIVDPDVVMVLLEQGDLIDYDDDGKPQNVESALKALVAKKPYLARANGQNSDAAAGTRGTGTPGGSMNDRIRQAAGRG